MDNFDCLKSKDVVHKTIIKDWFTQLCEDAPDLKGYKKFHLGLPVFCEKIWKKKSFQLRHFSASSRDFTANQLGSVAD